MNIIFMGTPDFAVPSLEILIRNRYGIVAVVTAPDLPRGRGQKILPTPVKEFALRHRLFVVQPERLKDESFTNQLKELAPDLIVVVAFRILPKEIFTLPRLGSFNLHASLLPKYRGAAPINWAIIKGEQVTGVSTFFLEEKVDTGRIILQHWTPIGEDETAGELHDRLSLMGADTILETVRLIESGRCAVRLQESTNATSAPKIFNEHCKIDWSKEARDIHNLVRGLSPHPGAYTYHQGRIIKIFKTQVQEPSPGPDIALTLRRSGEIVLVDRGLSVQCGIGKIRIVEIQLEGRKQMGIAEFLRGYRFSDGEILG